MNPYAKYFDKNNKCMNLVVNYKEILEKYSKIRNKISNSFRKEFDSEPVYNILLGSVVNEDKKYDSHIFLK